MIKRILAFMMVFAVGLPFALTGCNQAADPSADGATLEIVSGTIDTADVTDVSLTDTESAKDTSSDDADDIQTTDSVPDAVSSAVSTAQNTTDTVDKPSSSTDTEDVKTTSAVQNTNTSTSTETAQKDPSTCTHHRTSGDIWIRTVTWTEDATHLIWTCTQCGATGKDPKVTTDTSSANSGTSANTSTSTNTSTETLDPNSPYAVRATAETADLVAERMIYYINKYRAEEGNVTATRLPGLSEFCKYRSKQLVTNFAHDTNDYRAAAAALQYGKYVDPKLYGGTGDPYYTADAREAIALVGVEGSVDHVAKTLVDCFRESKSHWSYVGAVSKASDFLGTEYSYIGVGVTYSTWWYSCVCVNDVDTYG